MTDDKTKTTPQDARLISLSENYEIAYGTKQFGVNKERRAEAARRFGDGALPPEPFLKR